MVRNLSLVSYLKQCFRHGVPIIVAPQQFKSSVEKFPRVQVSSSKQKAQIKASGFILQRHLKQMLGYISNQMPKSVTDETLPPVSVSFNTDPRTKLFNNILTKLERCHVPEQSRTELNTIERVKIEFQRLKSSDVNDLHKSNDCKGMQEDSFKIITFPKYCISNK